MAHDTQLLESTPEGAGWTTRTVCCGGCLASASCVLSNAVVERYRRESRAVAIEPS